MSELNLLWTEVQTEFLGELLYLLVQRRDHGAFCPPKIMIGSFNEMICILSGYSGCEMCKSSYILFYEHPVRILDGSLQMIIRA